MNASTLLVIVSVVACTGREAARPSDSSAAADSTVAPSPAIDSGAPRLEPRDEANASFREFRERLLAALGRKDTAFLHSVVAPEIRTSFGADGGIRDFKEMWKTADSSSAIWATLSRVLQMGGKHDADTSFFAPYVFAFWPDSIDAFSNVAVTSANAAIRARPEARAEVIGTAYHSILRVLEWNGIPADVTPSSWARIELPDKRTGWMASGEVYSPVSWRAAFVRRGQQWVMILFVAGD
jgi:hypothetical protein